MTLRSQNRASPHPLGFYKGVSLGKTLQSLNLVLVKPRKDINSVSCCHNMTEIMLIVAFSTIHLINQSKHMYLGKHFGLVLNPILLSPISSVGSIADLRTGGCWFDPRLGQYSFRGLMIEKIYQ